MSARSTLNVRTLAIPSAQCTRFKQFLCASNRSYAGSSFGSRPMPMGSTRTRELTLSIVTSAPRSRASRLKWRTRTTSGPSKLGSVFLTRACTTLGPLARVDANSAPKSMSCVNTTWACTRAQDQFGIRCSRIAHGAPMNALEPSLDEEWHPRRREIHIDQDLHGSGSSVSCVR